ncbi:MAG: shikimate kinase [Clostridia bacterium]|nr:shikimate kinase [Clostridia bacterium]
MNVVLCGMMGAGKSTVGFQLARLAGKKWVDTDYLIEKRYGKISDIFASRGEAYFRALETDTVRSLSQKDGLVISTGGGLVMREENCALLKENGKIVFLRAKLQTLLSRVKLDGTRPLLKEGNVEEKLTALLEERMPVYERVSDLIVDTDGKKKYEIAREIFERLEGAL